MAEAAFRFEALHTLLSVVVSTRQRYAVETEKLYSVRTR